MKKVISVVGARPQFIKLAALSPEIRKHFKEIIVHSGQHYDYKMAAQFFHELNIPQPDYNLEIGSGKPGWQIGQIIAKMEEVIEKENPELVIVFGDTNTTAAAAIAAVKCDKKLAHVEAGLREFNKYVPEETNKLITDVLSDYFFTPTKTGVQNLDKMGITKGVYHIGDVALDLIVDNEEKINKAADILKKNNVKQGDYIFCTCHRAANTDDKKKLENILNALGKMNKKVIFPIHPRTKNAIEQHGLKHLLTKNINVVEPIGFFDTQALIKNAFACVTDSGGVIKETYFHKVPGIIIDTQTEWVETLEEGWNHLAGPNEEKILSTINNLKIPSFHSQALGDGFSSRKISEILFDNI